MRRDPKRTQRAQTAARRPGSEAGFTLMEVVIAMLILVTGMVSILALFAHAVGIHRAAVDDARTAMVAESVLDRLDFEWSESGSVGGVQGMTFEGPEVAPYAVSTSATEVADSEDALAVTVTLTWRRGTKEQEAVFHSVLLRDESAARLAEAKAAQNTE